MITAVEAGKAIVNLLESWQQVVRDRVDLSKSMYLTLSWSKVGWYQLHRFTLTLPDPEKLTWDFPPPQKKGEAVRASDDSGDQEDQKEEQEAQGKRLRGGLGGATIFEWYGESGGQLKYYPLAKTALWASDRFQLEPLPGDKIGNGIRAKAADYYPELWKKVNL